ncbi:dephospho-CoA kinase [Leucobacter sp. M11]|uniref:dephospho-CoA kinase n=1 Tax=Leucobacter sp. M11 TaxID=2993565 RepID=UPI002D80E191|nr:dephospho-CoA kinase [Leucobacter sp. M11]MEB4613057.1 dephospho-CoA kinase [Leucobacter sp. M11]
MFLIGLTGGIASGKSTIARRLAEHGAVHLDADQIARDAVDPGTPALARIADAFGPDVIAADGSLDRAALGAIVFADSAALATLNGIVHPAVLQLTADTLDRLRTELPERGVVVYDVPLLVEAKVNHPWDLVVVAHAPAAVRRERVIQLRGQTPEEADRRIAAQASDEERLAVADVVIDTAGDLTHTLEQTDALWERITA